MSVEVWAAYVGAAMIILVIPGPTIMLVISQALVHGRRAVVPLVAGVSLGDFTAMTLSLAGLGAILAASATAFSMLKWVGAAYLIYLGIRRWLSKPEEHESRIPGTSASNRSLFRSAFIVTALNPKSIAFFVAFLPQFINPEHQAVPQMVILGATFLFLAAVNATLYAVFAGRLRDKMQNATVRRWINRCGGTALIGAGVLLAAMHRYS